MQSYIIITPFPPLWLQKSSKVLKIDITPAHGYFVYMKKKADYPAVKPVHLKPLFGMKPGVWLTILYALIFVLLLFFIGFLPGIKHGSKRVTFTSDAYNAAVYIDGDYSGGTPYTVRVPSGNHSIEYKVNGVLLDSFEIKVSHPVFFTWLFPRKMEVSSSAGLNKEAYDALTKELFEDLATYSAILEYNSTHRYPPVFENYAKSVKDCSYFNKEILTDYAVCFITTDEMANDAKTAFSILGLGEPVIPKAGKFNTKKATLAPSTVTEADFALFTQANPFWSASNKEELEKQGLADSYYLEGTGTSQIKAVVNVSYYAAKAYCEWLSKRTGKTYFLPTQQQWTEACLQNKQTFAKTIIVTPNSETPSSMLGGVWEMTSSCFIPNGDSEKVQSFISDLGIDIEMVVKGGSYINSESEITAEKIGVSPRYLCSDYMGFRVAWYD